MKVVDSSGWLEYFADGPLADAYAEHLADPDEILTPTVVLYEVYRWVRRQRTDELALLAAAHLHRTRLVELDSRTALAAADLGIAHGLAMADAIVYATGHLNGAEVVTSDRDFEGLAGVCYLSR